MGDEDTSKGIDTYSPFYLHPASNTSIVTSPMVLHGGENYEEWSRPMRNNFKENNKIGFIDGSITQPTTPKLLDPWVQVNSMLGAWLHNTLDAFIRSTTPLTDHVKDMWDDLRNVSQLENDLNQRT